MTWRGAIPPIQMKMTMIDGKITAEEFNAAPVLEFDGNIVVINNETQAEAAAEAMRLSGRPIGFDTETRPSFVKGVTHEVSLVQLSAGNTAFLFRLNKLGGFSKALKGLLEDPQVQKIGLSTRDDFRNLRRLDDTFEPQNFVEIQQLVISYGIHELSLSKIYACLFGKKLSKRQRLSNWEASELSPKQQVYASLDAIACVDIYEKLMTMNSYEET